MRLIFFIGLPGSGKGTQAKALSKIKKIKTVSIGSLLRDEIKSGSRVGKKIEVLISKGSLAPLGIIKKLIKKLIKDYKEKEVIIDGFPRNKKQAKFFVKQLNKHQTKEVIAIELTLTEKESIKRLLKRAKIEKRRDDNLETIRERIKLYNETIHDIRTVLKRANIKYKKVDGMGSIKQVQNNLKKIL